MQNYYSIEIRVRFGVLADSQEDAEEIAQKLVPIDDFPPGADPICDAYLTPNQCASIKKTAVNA
jgi:hypothetical protein